MMRPERADAPLTELDNLLNAEREALLAGDLEKLGSLLEPKETLIERMNSLRQFDLPAIKDLSRKVRRNQLLLNGALEGIRAVSSRLAKLRDVKGAFETYGADGKKRDITAVAETSVERRA